jgi:UDP-2,3-diacylglucosamine hydrolase
MKLSIFDHMATLPPLTPLAAPVFFFSDAHLGAVLIPDPQKQQENLDRFFEKVQMEGKTLVLAGDLFDFWFEWRHVIPKQPFLVLHRLRTLVEQGIAVHYLAGNHDFRLRGFLENVIGLHVHADALCAEIAGQSVYVYHGDGVLARDHGYRLLKKMLRNRAAQRLFTWLHPDCGMALAHGTSKTSRTLIKENPEEDREYLAFARRKFADGYQAVVLGHTHRPVQYEENGRVYVNLGDWISHYSYACHDGASLELRYLDR